jgi:hypothetical protein
MTRIIDNTAQAGRCNNSIIRTDHLNEAPKRLFRSWTSLYVFWFHKKSDPPLNQAQAADT